MFGNPISIKNMISRYNLGRKRKQPVVEDPIRRLESLIGGQEIEREHNHLYFYTDVNQESCLALNKKIIEVSKELLKYSIDYDCPPPAIYLHINSNGGCLFSAFSTVDTIKASKVPVISIVEGCAASAATVISMVCKRRYLTPNSYMLIHQLSSGMYGKYEEIKDDFLNDTKMMDRLYALYEQHTTIPPKKIKSVLARDIWWDANECVANGLVDDVWNGSPTRVSIKDAVTGERTFPPKRVKVAEEEKPAERERRPRSAKKH